MCVSVFRVCVRVWCCYLFALNLAFWSFANWMADCRADWIIALPSAFGVTFRLKQKNKKHDRKKMKETHKRDREKQMHESNKWEKNNEDEIVANAVGRKGQNGERSRWSTEKEFDRPTSILTNSGERDSTTRKLGAPRVFQSKLDSKKAGRSWSNCRFVDFDAKNSHRKVQKLFALVDRRTIRR